MNKKMKRTFSALISAAMLLTLIPMTFAVEELPGEGDFSSDVMEEVSKETEQTQAFEELNEDTGIALSADDDVTDADGMVIKSFFWNAEELTGEVTGTFTHKGVTTYGASKSSVAGSGKTFTDGTSFEKVFKFGTPSVYLEFKSLYGGKVTVYAVSPNSSTRAVKVKIGDKPDISMDLVDKELKPAGAYDVSAGDTVKIYSNEGINIYGVKFVSDTAVPQTDAEWKSFIDGDASIDKVARADSAFNALTGDFTLSTAMDYPFDETASKPVTIAWTSSDSEVIAVDGGTARVTRPRFDEKPVSVKLTAEITVGSETLIKEFTVRVLPLENPETDEERMLYANNQLHALGFDTAANKVVTGDVNFPAEIEGVSIEWKSNDASWITDDGKIVRYPASGSQNVTVTAVLTLGSLTQTNEYGLTIRRAAAVKAFPGAQGYGTQTRGGAGGYVYHVTSLGATGPGTLHEALEQKSGARTIVFDVGGTIDLTPLGRALKMSGEDDSNVTIAGQTAPGDGIQLKGYGITLSSVHDVIIRNISIRIGNVRKAGDTYQSDPLSATGANRRVVLDHLSMCWGVDMGFRIYGQEMTMSNSMISKGLYWNTPHEKGMHNYAGIFGPKYGTFYGNYIADCGQRAPRIADNEFVDIRNNVIFNSKYTFDICNYEWMGANPKFNVVGNVVLNGNPAPAGSTSNASSNGSYRYFQGRTYSGGLFAYSAGNYDEGTGGRLLSTSKDEAADALWTGSAPSEDVLKGELSVYGAGSYSNTKTPWRNMILPGNISLSDYDNSAVSKKGNTLVNYPFAAPTMKTYSPKDTVKYVLTNAGARIGKGQREAEPRMGILDSRYLAEARTRLQILSDYSKASQRYGIQLDNSYTGDTAYGLPVETHTVYIDENGRTIYDVDGGTVTDPSGMTVQEQYKFVTNEGNTFDTLYAIDTKGENKYRVVLRDYTDEDDIYDSFDIYDVNGNALTKPGDYRAAGSASGMPWGNVVLKFAEWGDGAGNYDHSGSVGSDGNLGVDIVDTEWTEDDWPQLPTVYRDGDFDSDGDGIPDFFVKLMGWDKRSDYTGGNISRMDFEGRGYTNLEYYINDYLMGDQEPADSEEMEPVEAENVRDGSSKYNTHKSHEILFNTMRRAKAKVYYNEGNTFDADSAKEIALNSVYDYADSAYSDARDFSTYFSAIITGTDNPNDAEGGLKPGTIYSYKIKTYSDTGVESMSAETYHFTTAASSSGKPGRPRVTQYVPYDGQITLTFEPYSAPKTYEQKSYGSGNQTRYLTAIGNNEYDTKTDHYILRYAASEDMSDAKEVKLPATVSRYVLRGLTNDTDYYLDLRAVSADGTMSSPALVNKKKAEETGEKDKDGNPVFGVHDIAVNGNKVEEYYSGYDVELKTLPIQPTKYVVNENYIKNLQESEIGEGDTTKFITVYGDEKDWYIYTLGGIPIPTSYQGSGPMLMLRDESHDHGFTYAKKFDTILDGRSTIRAKIMIRDEELDPMNQAPEFRFYIQQDSADLGDTDADVESTSDNTATTFGNIVTLQFTKNDIIYNGGKSVFRYSADEWYDIKLLMDADAGTCSLYINDSLIGKDLEYSDSATSNNIARWQISSRLAGTEDVYVEYMYAYSGWEEPVSDPDAPTPPDHTVDEGTSGFRPGAGSNGGGGGGGAKPSTPATPGVDPGTPDDNKQTTDFAFTDMGGFEWASEAVNELHKRNIANGVSETQFEPGREITRAEFLALLLRGFDLLNEEASCNFEDVPRDSWYYPVVAKAYSMGIVSGYDEHTFGANDTILRQDMAVMVMRLMNSLGRKIDSVRVYEGFADESEISDYAKTAVSELYEGGIINGVGDGCFEPNGTANRASAAMILYAALKGQWNR